MPIEVEKIEENKHKEWSYLGDERDQQEIDGE